MSPLSLDLVAELARTTLALAVAALLVLLLLRLVRPGSPAVYRAAWLAVLVVGWLWVRVPVAIPYQAQPAPMPTEARAGGAQAASERAVEVAGPTGEPRPGAAPAGRWSAASWTAGQPAVPAPIVPEVSDPPSPSDAPDPSAAAGPGPWPSVLVGAWCAGMALWAAAWGLGYGWFLLRLSPPAEGDPAWHAEWSGLLRPKGIRASIPLHVTARMGPVLCRLPRGYRLLVPGALWRRLGPEGRASVARHELAHWQRGDVWKSFVVRLLALPHWFNPLAWLAVRRFDEAAQWACDAAARGDSPATAAQYARSLLALDQWAGQRAVYRAAAWGRGLSQRIRRLVTPNLSEDSVMKRLLVLVAAAVLVAVCLIRIDLVAKEPAGEPETPAAAEPSGSAPAEAAAPAAKPLSAEAAATAPPDAPAAERVPKKGIPSQALRYDGKTLAQWRQEFQTELKPERRTEAIRAFAAFGRHGYGKEATEAILEVMRDVSVMVIDDTPVGKLKQAALDAFKAESQIPEEGWPIDPAEAVPVLVKELKEGNRNGRLFAAYVLMDLGPHAKAATAALVRACDAEKDPEINWLAQTALVRADPTGEIVVAHCKKALAANDVQRATNWLHHIQNPQWGISPYPDLWFEPGFAKAERTPGGLAGGPPSKRLTAKGRTLLKFLLETLEHKNPDIREWVLRALGTLGPSAKEAVPGIVRVLDQGDHGDSREVQAAAEALRAMGPAAEDAVPALARALPKTDDLLAKTAIAYALQAIGPAAKTALPVLLEEISKPRNPLAVSRAKEAGYPQAAGSLAGALMQTIRDLGGRPGDTLPRKESPRKPIEPAAPPKDAKPAAGG